MVAKIKYDNLIDIEDFVEESDIIVHCDGVMCYRLTPRLEDIFDLSN